MLDWVDALLFLCGGACALVVNHICARPPRMPPRDDEIDWYDL